MRLLQVTVELDDTTGIRLGLVAELCTTLHPGPPVLRSTFYVLHYPWRRCAGRRLPPEPANLVLTFGKYRDRHLGEVFQLDPGSGDWLAREGRDEVVHTAARSLLTAPSNAPESRSEDVPF